MWKCFPVLLVLISLVTGCEPAVQSAETTEKLRYRQALAAAERRPIHDTIAFGLRFGMDSVRVEARLDSLCRILEPAGSDTSVTITAVLNDDTIKPLTAPQRAKFFLARPCPQSGYVDGRLVGLSFNFEKDNTDPEALETYDLLVNQLTRWYGQPGYSHIEGEMPAHNDDGYTCHSWFQDGIEIHLSPGLGLRQGWGAILSYQDIRRYPIFINRQFEASLR